MKNLYKIRFLALVVLILSTLTKQATAQSQWGHTKEWKIHSMGEYTLSARELNSDNSSNLFEERDSIILIGLQSVQPNKIPENTELPNYTQFVVGSQEVNDPITIWSKKTKDFIKVKSNWQWPSLVSPEFHKGYNSNTFLITENNSNVFYKAVITGDSINYTKLSFFSNPKDILRLVCESDKYIVVIASKFIKTVGSDDWYYFDSAYVYDDKTHEHIKTMTPFAGYRHMSMKTIAYKEGKFFLGGWHSPSMSGASFIFDVDKDTSYLSGIIDGFNPIYVKKLGNQIYITSLYNRLKRWVSGTTWEEVKLKGSDTQSSVQNWFPLIDQFGNYFYVFEHSFKNPKGKYFNPDSATLYGEYKRDYLLYPQDGGIWVLNEEQQVEYYNKFGYTWLPIRVVAVDTDTFMFGWNNMIAKLVDRKNTSIADQETKTLLVYPNPANGFVTVSTPIDVTFTVTDLTGKIVLTGITNQNADVSTLNKGIYFIRIEGYTPTKLIIQ